MLLNSNIFLLFKHISLSQIVLLKRHDPYVDGPNQLFSSYFSLQEVWHQYLALRQLQCIFPQPKETIFSSPALRSSVFAQPQSTESPEQTKGPASK